MLNSDVPVALITGCGKENGIGAAIAQQLANDGSLLRSSMSRPPA